MLPVFLVLGQDMCFLPFVFSSIFPAEEQNLELLWPKYGGPKPDTLASPRRPGPVAQYFEGLRDGKAAKAASGASQVCDESVGQ